MTLLPMSGPYGNYDPDTGFPPQSNWNLFGGMFGKRRTPMGSSDAITVTRGGPLPTTPPAAQDADNSRWLDGGKFTGKDALGLALGAIGDAFSGHNTIGQMVNDTFANQRDVAAKTQEAALQRAAQWNQWVAQQQYEAAHPKPGADEQLAIGAGLTPGTPEYQTMLRNLLTAKTDPYVATTLPNDHFYAGPRSGLGSALGMGASNGPPAAAIQALQANPALRAQFEQKYGAGSSAQYLGGGAGNGTGGFRNIPSGNPLYP